MRERRVVIVAFEGVQPLDAVGPHEVFAGATRAAAAQGRPGGYRVAVASAGGGAVRAESGLELGTVPLPDPSERIDTLVLAGGSGANAAAADEALVAWIAAAAPRCRRVATVCSGAFLGAAAGLLEGRRVTTHWARAGELRATYPGPRPSTPTRSTSATGSTGRAPGVTAGIDLSLALVQDDLGVDVAQIGGPLAGHVPAPARRPDPVRLAGVGPPRRALHGPGRADPRRDRARRRPPRRRPWRPPPP